MKLLGILVSLSFGCVSLHCMDRMDRMDQATSPIGTPPGSAQASPFGSPASKELATINDLQKNTPKRKALAATLAGLGFAPAEKGVQEALKEMVLILLLGQVQTYHFNKLKKTQENE
ncbi:MAG: hypothetical protein LVQ75_01415 [Candidatus Babeliales bacterium]|jgi:hypothetical protein